MNTSLSDMVYHPCNSLYIPRLHSGARRNYSPNFIKFLYMLPAAVIRSSSYDGLRPTVRHLANWTKHKRRLLFGLVAPMKAWSYTQHRKYIAYRIAIRGRPSNGNRYITRTENFGEIRTCRLIFADRQIDLQIYSDHNTFHPYRWRIKVITVFYGDREYRDSLWALIMFYFVTTTSSNNKLQ